MKHAAIMFVLTLATVVRISYFWVVTPFIPIVAGFTYRLVAQRRNRCMLVANVVLVLITGAVTTMMLVVAIRMELSIPHTKWEIGAVVLSAVANVVPAAILGYKYFRNQVAREVI